MSNVCCIFVSDFKKQKDMKNLLCFVCFGLLMLTATHASPLRDAVQTTSETVVFTADAPPNYADFVFMLYNMDMTATAPEETHVYYDAPVADCSVQVFDISLPVFRLCGEYSHNTYNQKPRNCALANSMRATARHVRV